MSDEPREPEENEAREEPTGPEEAAEPEGGPAARQEAFLEERFATLRPKGPEDEEEGEAPDLPLVVPPEGLAAVPEAETREPEEPERLPGTFRRNLVEQYRDRQKEKLSAQEAEEAEDEEEGEEGSSGGSPREPPSAEMDTEPIAPGEPPAPAPANNWTPIGPSVLRQGQGAVKAPTSGRTPGLAVAADGERVYIGAANGGVWRSDDAGRTWRSLMEAFDLNPTHRASDSLACGAVAIDPTDPDRLFVGSGEGAGGAYFGVGPIVSTDGGTNWQTESVAPGNPQLAGSAFYALAVDPANPDRVVAATRRGLYRREPDGTGGFNWAKKILPGSSWVTSAVVAHGGGTTTFYAVPWGGLVHASADGHTWSAIGTGFPTANVARIGLAVQENNPSVVYALVCRSDNYHLHGVYRLDTNDGNWRKISGVPQNLFGPRLSSTGQGWYDLAIAVAPDNVNRLYLGGSTVFSGGDWSGSLFRCEVSESGGDFSMTSTYIGDSIHADVHAIAFAPGDASKLWVGCDGGVFYSTNPLGNRRVFEPRNTGLATLTMNYIDQHPTEESVAFCGTQDNGGVRFTGEEAWLYSSGGDGGFAVINWHDPYKVLSTYTRGSVRRSTDGGSRYSYSNVNVPLANNEGVLFYAPIAGTPPNPDNPDEADLVAFGSVRPWISTTFGGNWRSIPDGALADDSLNGRIRSLMFASADKLYAGTMNGGVYRFDKLGTNWARTRIDILGGADQLPLAGPVTDLIADPADSSGNSIYIALGGTGDFRHVWHFDGGRWEQRSGPAAGDLDSLLDVQMNALASDPANPGHIYAGADIGVWRSVNGGSTWTSYSEGLPDASVLDLKLHTERGLLRAATHGRGVFERTLEDLPVKALELYVRATQLDLGRRPVENDLPDPTKKGDVVKHSRGPDIKLDPPDANGNHQFPLTDSIDFLQFVDGLVDESDRVAAHVSPNVTTRVHVQVHNRGVQSFGGVRVMLLLANISNGMPALPSGYAAKLQNGTAIEDANWQTVGTTTLESLHAGAPKIASFNLVSGMLPPPSDLVGNDQFCVLALLHHAGDPFTASETDVNALCLSERKAAHRTVKVVAFTGSVPEDGEEEDEGCLAILRRLFGIGSSS